MYLVGIDVSPRQKSNLKNGKRVRVKQGKGLNLIVRPENYDVLNRAFRKRKGAEIQLSNEELEENAVLSPEEQMNIKESLADRGVDTDMASIEGQGLYARGGRIGKTLKKVDKAAKKHHAGKVAKKIYKNPIVRNTVRGAVVSALAEEGIPPPVALGALSAGERMAGVGIFAGSGMYAGAGMFAGGNVNGEEQEYKGEWNSPTAPPSRGSNKFSGENLIHGKYTFNMTQPQALEPQPQFENHFFNFIKR